MGVNHLIKLCFLGIGFFFCGVLIASFFKTDSNSVNIKQPEVSFNVDDYNRPAIITTTTAPDLKTENKGKKYAKILEIVNKLNESKNVTYFKQFFF